MKILIQSFFFLIFIISLFCPNFCYEYTPIKSYETISISLTLEKPYKIFQYKNEPYQPNSGSILLKFRKGSESTNSKIYIYNDFSKIKEGNKGEFLGYNNYEYLTTKIKTGIYYIIISSPNYNYKDTFEVINGFEYYELKENEIIFKNWTEKFKKTRYFRFKTPSLLEKKYFHILGYFTSTYYTSSELTLNKEID